MVVGVSKGFAKRLQLVGVGYRAMLEVRDLVLSLAFSHPVRMAIPDAGWAATEGRGEHQNRSEQLQQMLYW